MLVSHIVKRSFVGSKSEFYLVVGLEIVGSSGVDPNDVKFKFGGTD